ncbi:alpha-D-ribose 1-methylphosphonate 5-triphosphate diphosphatase [Cribrihabitans marinus]|uniref:Alpha-D-ribose 1-methylphosphonate 5-triphosphate diphosphatase n=1 Tax=Cribrihabitans marinus TaxID=1227549 RepID=A0A1H7AH63_9RHOB|nr:alpha-D-ribose 1-methylphosphonate 5-triphosphate diphosphatase [Cribrihabitans marinus]GGH31757.1 alpha-D-ribose 1-methylphosphonate 5-triphosphate diphosphatase [Cribrihabitans marinus]SEJ64929.1 alpha-D-ribose 1-methylphosphonate 5-triphosphate diphosphatase [Cribrihabitans marinus]
MSLDLTLRGATVLRPGRGPVAGDLPMAGGLLTDAPAGRAIDLSGYLILPGIVDLHGDGFERHLAPRRGVVSAMDQGIMAAEAELAANGITTAVLAQFWSWEGGVRGPDFAARVFQAIAATRGTVATDLRSQLRLEVALLDDYDRLPAMISDWGVSYVVFNDHLPRDRLSEGRTPPRLTGQALKAGRSPEAHLELLHRLHARRAEEPAALERLCAELAASGIHTGSHDDRTADARRVWRNRGVRIAEFPETVEAAEAARAGGDAVILGAPNAVRGASHKGNVSALDLIAMGLCDALASDYHYPSPRRAALMLAQSGVLDLASAWALVSEGPARILGLTDRGRLEPGLRADLVILDARTRQVAATFAGGRVSYMSGEIAARFLG